MKHEFRNTAAAIQHEEKEPKLEWLEHRLFLNLGRIHDWRWFRDSLHGSSKLITITRKRLFKTLHNQENS